ncbi:hypothetical protein M0R88_18130 [Halorussus gelatinilyticus]|uniref:Uncharacterized protein n=1 Tax=Halorussus gelatinilyticus TaxID=2937524 RepID=A0A8U0IK26_9EURY|nr:hypothetical protein [Halorussus gelatinilyticus]UPW00409.1 hypothetical protein M0R88_18130 [Halorussus gelatinilyticus]
MTEKYDSANGRDDDRGTDRYAAFKDGGGEVVVYDTKNNAAWVKSDAAVVVEEMV